MHNKFLENRNQRIPLEFAYPGKNLDLREPKVIWSLKNDRILVFLPLVSADALAGKERYKPPAY
jgi:hypothetical protein